MRQRKLAQKGTSSDGPDHAMIGHTHPPLFTQNTVVSGFFCTVIPVIHDVLGCHKRHVCFPRPRGLRLPNTYTFPNTYTYTLMMNTYTLPPSFTDEAARGLHCQGTSILKGPRSLRRMILHSRLFGGTRSITQRVPCTECPGG